MRIMSDKHSFSEFLDNLKMLINLTNVENK